MYEPNGEALLCLLKRCIESADAVAPVKINAVNDIPTECAFAVFIV